MTKQNIRDRKAKQFTETFEEAASIGRETQYETIVTLMSENYMFYMIHRLKFFSEGIRAYTTKHYSRLALDQYVSSQKAMDDIVHQLTDAKQNGPIILSIGATEFASNSPIKRYWRCPGTRKLINYIKKITNCDVVFTDGYNTSQVCGRCYRRF